MAKWLSHIIRSGRRIVNTCFDDDLKLIAASGGHVSVPPRVEMAMEHGYPATGRLLEAGIRGPVRAAAAYLLVLSATTAVPSVDAERCSSITR